MVSEIVRILLLNLYLFITSPLTYRFAVEFRAGLPRPCAGHIHSAEESGYEHTAFLWVLVGRAAEKSQLRNHDFRF